MSDNKKTGEFIIYQQINNFVLLSFPNQKMAVASCSLVSQVLIVVSALMNFGCSIVNQKIRRIVVSFTFLTCKGLIFECIAATFFEKLKSDSVVSDFLDAIRLDICDKTPGLIAIVT